MPANQSRFGNASRLQFAPELRGHTPAQPAARQGYGSLEDEDESVVLLGFQ